MQDSQLANKERKFNSIALGDLDVIMVTDSGQGSIIHGKV